MKKIFILIFSIFIFNEVSAVTGYAYRISFTNKTGSLTFADSSQFLSPKSLLRRSKQQIPLEFADLPIVPKYIDSVYQIIDGKQLHNKSKWFNQVVIIVDDTTKMQLLTSISFVQDYKLVAIYSNWVAKPNVAQQHVQKINKFPDTFPLLQKTTGDPAYYGTSFQQINLHNGDILHDQGFRGQNMTIAVLDAGFKSVEQGLPFDTMHLQNRLLATWNFVKDTSDVYELNNNHGTNVLGCMTGIIKDKYVGTAPNASYYLFMTEDVGSEQPIEEDNWISALEYADSAGVDIFNSSLGYYDFDSPFQDFTYSDLDGKSTLMSKACNKAAKTGMIPIVSQGNEGTSAFVYLTNPADADSAYSVGMVDGSGIWCGSGYGPNSSNKTKPDGVALGCNAMIVNSNDQVATSNGSSFASPILCGLVACFWQKFPQLHWFEVLDYVRASSDRYTTPNDTHGFGIPDFSKASQLILDFDKTEEALEGLKLYPNPSNDGVFYIKNEQTNHPYSYSIFDMQGRLISFNKNCSKSVLRINDLIQFPTGNYFIKIEKENKMITTSLLIQK